MSTFPVVGRTLRRVLKLAIEKDPPRNPITGRAISQSELIYTAQKQLEDCLYCGYDGRACTNVSRPSARLNLNPNPNSNLSHPNLNRSNQTHRSNPVVGQCNYRCRRYWHVYGPLQNFGPSAYAHPHLLTTRDYYWRVLVQAMKNPYFHDMSDGLILPVLRRAEIKNPPQYYPN